MLVIKWGIYFFRNCGTAEESILESYFTVVKFWERCHFGVLLKRSCGKGDFVLLKKSSITLIYMTICCEHSFCGIGIFYRFILNEGKKQNQYITARQLGRKTCTFCLLLLILRTLCKSNLQRLKGIANRQIPCFKS